MNFRTALHDGKVARIEVLDGYAKVIIDEIPIACTGTDSISRALREWESDPAEDMYTMLTKMENGEHFGNMLIQQVRNAYRSGKQKPFIKCDPKAIVIELSYRSKVYIARSRDTSASSNDPFEAIKLILEKHNYNVHEEMYRILKDIQITHNNSKIDEVIRRYESK